MTVAAAYEEWRIADVASAAAAHLGNDAGVPPLVAHLLLLRGAASHAEAKRFLRPALSHIEDPFQLTDMRAAADRIRQARDRDEPVLVFGDYDVDGVAGVALLVRALRRFGVKRCAWALPNRIAEGYGIGPDHVRAAADQGVRLVITVDNGVSAVAAAEEAARLGIDMVVTDHHEPVGALPTAAAVIDPKREPDGCRSADASGALVALKLAWALTGDIADLDLAAVGTVADVVPLIGENRVVTSLGLDAVRQGSNLGLAALARAANVALDDISAERVAFQLAPRLNAAGRLATGDDAVELLLTDDPDGARRIAAALDQANEERRRIEKDMLDDALEQLNGSWDESQRSIVLARRGWHPGVVGIVAGRLARRYRRPVVLIAVDSAGLGRGSARSAETFDLVTALAGCAGHLERFGGHCAAAGITLSEQQVEGFREAFEACARSRLAEAPTGRGLDIDAAASLGEVDSQLVSNLNLLQPFGHGNPPPVFCAFGVKILPGSLRELRGGHVRFAVKQGPALHHVIGFRMSERLARFDGPLLDIAFTPQFNTWRGETTIQLVLKDMKEASR